MSKGNQGNKRSKLIVVFNRKVGNESTVVTIPATLLYTGAPPLMSSFFHVF